MSGISSSLSIAVLALAAISAIAVWWVLHQDRELQRRALGLRRHLVAELSSHRARLELMPERALAIAARDGRAMNHEHVVRTRSRAEEFARLDALLRELVGASMGLEHAHGRKLWDMFHKLEAVSAKVTVLDWEVELREALGEAETVWSEAPPAQDLPKKAIRSIA